MAPTPTSSSSPSRQHPATHRIHHDAALPRGRLLSGHDPQVCLPRPASSQLHAPAPPQKKNYPPPSPTTATNISPTASPTTQKRTPSSAPQPSQPAAAATAPTPCTSSPSSSSSPPHLADPTYPPTSSALSLAAPPPPQPRSRLPSPPSARTLGGNAGTPARGLVSGGVSSGRASKSPRVVS